MRVLVMNKSRFVSSITSIIIAVMLSVVALIVFLPNNNIVSASNTMGAIYKGNTEGNNVSIMFNVYGGEEYIDEIIDILNDNNVSATFFLGGCWAAKNNDVVKKIKNSGFEIANHGYNHLDHSKQTLEVQKKEIEDNHDLIKSICDVEMNLFAPPSGDYNRKTVEIAESLGYKTIMWSKDTIDWRDQDSTLIYSRAVKNISSGDLVLMHPTKATVEALDDIIKYYKDSGFNVTTVSDNLGI